MRQRKKSPFLKAMSCFIAVIMVLSSFPTLVYAEPVFPEPTSWPLQHVAVQAGDTRIQNNSLRMDIGRLGQVTRLNIIDSDLSRAQNIVANREMNFVAGQHNWADAFNNSADHQWLGEMIFSIRSASSREGLATAGRFVEVDTNRTLQAGGRATNNNPSTDPNLNPFFNRVRTGPNQVTVQFNPDNMPTGNEANPSGGNLTTNVETFGVTAPRNERIIKDFKVDSVFSADTDDDSILWSITISNPTGKFIEFGDVGLPMLWNVRYSRQNTTGDPGNNTQHVYDNAVTSHSFQGADSGYMKVMPTRGDNFLLFTPVAQSGARIEYVDHWTRANWGVSNVHRTGFGMWGNDQGVGNAGNANNYNLPGMTVAYIHSANIRNISGSSYFHDTNNGPTYFTDTNRFPARYNPVAPGTGFVGGGNSSGPEYTPLFTTLVLGPGESQTYQFKYHAVRGGDGEPDSVRGGRNNLMNTQDLEANHMMEREMNMRSIIHDMGMIDAVAAPSFQPAINMPTLVALRHDPGMVRIRDVKIYSIHENDVFSNQNIPAWGSQAGRNRSRVDDSQGGRGLADGNPGYERSVELREDLSGYQDGEWVSVYELRFDCIGQNSLRVYYDLMNDNQVIRPAFTQFEFNVLAELDQVAMTHANFLRTNQQFSTENNFQFTGDPAQHALNGIYFDWHLNSGPSRINGFSTADIFTPPAGAPADTRWGDDWSHGHAQFMAMANYMNPTVENIKSLETYLIDFMWNGYMKNRHDSLLVPNFLQESPLVGNTSTTSDRFFSAAIVANTYFNMYRTMRAFPNFVEYREDALFYLDIAAGIWDNGLRGGWGQSSGVAFYGEQQVEDIIQSLHNEGRDARRNSLRHVYSQLRAPGALNSHWPFGSEFEYDNTTDEGIYARTLSLLRHVPNHSGIMQGSDNRTLRLMQSFNWATRAKRGWQPTWFQYGVPVFRAGESWWNFQYTTSLAGFVMDNWLRFQSDSINWDQDSIAWANRVNYAAKTGNFNHVNMGQMSASSIGAASVTYSLRKGAFGSQAVQVATAPTSHNGWHDMGMEAPLAMYGSLLSVSTDVVNDPIFGPFAYGGDVTTFDNSSITVRPTDGFGRRLNFMDDKVYVTSKNNRITEARFARNKSSLELDLHNLNQRAHIAEIDTYGLTPGYYEITLNGTPAGQFFVQSADRNESSLVGVGPRAKEATALVSIPDGNNFTVALARVTNGTAASPSLNVVSQFINPIAGEKLPLLVQVVGDGSAAISSVKWTVVSTPVGGSVSFNSTTPVLGGDITTNGRRNSVWTQVDTSTLKNALATPSTPGTYVLRAAVTTGEFTVEEEITLKVTLDGNTPTPEAVLQTLINNANALTETNYTTESWSAFASTLLAAQTLAANADTTEDDIVAATSSLQAAIDALMIVPADKATLLTLIDDAITRIQSNYTIDSWSAFATVLLAAQTVAEDQGAMQTDVDTAASNLQGKMDDLMDRIPVTAADLVLYYKFDGSGTSGALKDYSKNAHNTTINGTISEGAWSADGFAFSGAQNIMLPSTVELVNPEMTIVFKVKRTSDISSNVSFFWGKNSENWNGNGLWINSAEGLYIFHNGGAETAFNLGTNANTLFPLNEWTEVGYSIDTTGATAKGLLTVNGVPYTATPYAIPATAKITQPTASLNSIGIAGYSNEQLNNMIMGKYMIFDRALTQPELLSAYNNTLIQDQEPAVDKAALLALIASATELSATTYTAESWSVFAAALLAAETVAGSEPAVQEDVDAAVASLQGAIGALVIKPIDKTVLTELIAEAEALKEEAYTAESWTVFAAALLAAETVAGSDTAVQADVDAAIASLQGAMGALVIMPTDNKIKIDLQTEEQVTILNPVTFIISLANMKNVMTASFTFEVDGDMLESTGLEALNAFTAMSGATGTIKWTQIPDTNHKKGEVTLMFLADPENGITSVNGVNVLKLMFAAKELGQTTMTLTGAKISGLDDGGEVAFLDWEAIQTEATTHIVKHYSIYDLNEDEVVDQLDLTIAQRSYQKKQGELGWSAAAKADVNGDGTVDMLDLILIFVNYSN